MSRWGSLQRYPPRPCVAQHKLVIKKRSRAPYGWLEASQRRSSDNGTQSNGDGRRYVYSLVTSSYGGDSIDLQTFTQEVIVSDPGHSAVYQAEDRELRIWADVEVF